MPGSRELKRRIKSIKNTKKITRAMQMISAVKMRKAQQAVLGSRTFADLAWEIVNNLSGKVDPKYHPLLEQKNEANKKTGVILITSNRGLIGSFNENLYKAIDKFVAEKDREVIAEFIVLGKKGRESMLRAGKRIVAEFPKYDRAVGIKEVLPLSKLITDSYLRGDFGKIILVYTDFVSTITQKPQVKELLPFVSQDRQHQAKLPTKSGKSVYEYLFEPSPEEVLNYLIPRIIESQLYQAILESDASEHSARMVMMKNATDAASDLIDDLTLTYNQLRQAGITKELAEITAGRSALE